jgi:hypothetical protein
MKAKGTTKSYVRNTNAIPGPRSGNENEMEGMVV